MKDNPFRPNKKDERTIIAAMNFALENQHKVNLNVRCVTECSRDDAESTAARWEGYAGISILKKIHFLSQKDYACDHAGSAVSHVFMSGCCDYDVFANTLARFGRPDKDIINSFLQVIM